MVVYNMEVHLPSQIQNFLDSLTSGDTRIMEISLGNIKEMVKEDGFADTLDKYLDTMEKKTDKIEKDTIVSIKNDPKVKTLDDILVLINEAKKEQIEEYNTYLKNSKSFIISYLKGK